MYFIYSILDILAPQCMWEGIDIFMYLTRYSDFTSSLDLYYSNVNE